MAEHYYDAVPSDPTEWVGFTEEVFPVTRALAVTVLVGADGSRLPHGLRLLPSNVRCEATPDLRELGAHTWCIPTVRAVPGDGFPTDQCTGEHLAGACEPTDVIALRPYGQLADLFETGERISTVYFENPNEGGKCMTFPPAWTSAPNPSVFYRSGPRLTPEHYPALTRTQQGSGRLQVEYLTSGGKNLFVESYFDTTYAVSCTPTELSTGGTWCLPANISFTANFVYNVYADASCTRPIASYDPHQGKNPYQFALVYQSGHGCC